MKTYFKALGILALLLIGLAGFGFVSGMIGAAVKVASTPQRVINKAFDTDNVIHKYEWFHDVYTLYGARKNQVMQFKKFLGSEEDKYEKQRLRMEMAAQQQSCRDLAAKYNANSEKMNVSIFKGWTLPDRLSTQECEA